MNPSQIMTFGMFYHFLSNDKSANSNKFVSYFRSKKALTAKNSISLSVTDLASLGWKNQKFEVSKLYTFLEKKSDGTYWLDESKIPAYQNKIKQTNIRFALIAFIILALIIIKIIIH